MIGKYGQQGRDRGFVPGGVWRQSRPCHTKGGDCLGISPPSQKGKESKEAHEAGHMQDLKPKHVKKKFKKASNMMPKTSKNEGPNLSKSSLGGLLGPHGRILEKKLRALPSWSLNLGAKIEAKIKK